MEHNKFHYKFVATSESTSPFYSSLLTLQVLQDSTDLLYGKLIYVTSVYYHIPETEMNVKIRLEASY